MPLARSIEVIKEGTHLGLFFPEVEQLWYATQPKEKHKDLLAASGLKLTDKTVAFELYRRERFFRVIAGPSSSTGIPRRDVQPVKEHLLGLPRNDRIEVTIFDDQALDDLMKKYGD